MMSRNVMASSKTQYTLQLNLYCESEFESDSNSSVDYGVEDNIIGIQPYQYEPDMSGSEEQSVTSEGESDDFRLGRLFSNDWCQCGNCEAMVTVKESLCCWEIEQMTTLSQEKGVQCITEHPGFHSMCLDVYVLQTCYSWYHQQYRRTITDENNRYRYTAYRMVTRFVWGWLGKDIRVTLPACAVHKIRQAFPSADGSYTGYLEPE